MWDVRERDGHHAFGTGQKDDYDVMMDMMMMEVGSSVLYLKKSLQQQIHKNLANT
jgi:hypothetical protein